MQPRAVVIGGDLPAGGIQDRHTGAAVVIAHADHYRAVTARRDLAVVRGCRGGGAGVDVAVEQRLGVHHIHGAGTVAEQREHVVVSDLVSGFGAAEANVGHRGRRGGGAV